MAREKHVTKEGAATAAPLALVKMIRPGPMHAGGPTTADVHPAEVENWKSHGWTVKKEIAG